jgi:hypothetical protein
MQGYLYVADPEGREIPGSRRSLAGLERGTGQFAEIENELKRLAGEECVVIYSEDKGRLSGPTRQLLGGLAMLACLGLAIRLWAGA